MTPGKHKIKVAVIGAGAAGLCAGRHLTAEPENFEFDIYEQQDNVGGTWRYSSDIGQDQYGLPVHSSMYKNLKTNLPKEVMAFPDFPFEECEGKSFLHHTQVLHYLEEYAKRFGLYPCIKFRKLIENVRPLSQGEGAVEWSVSFQDVITKEKETYIYDAVMVCNGHYSVPYIPDIEGLNDFQGVLLHSHDYRDPEQFKGMKVVVLGAGASGIDIAMEISALAKEVIMSHNIPRKTCPFPRNLHQENGVESVQKTSVTFIGGKQYDCDAFIICTGYLYHYPFLDPTCQLEIGDQRVSPLYLHLFHIKLPSLAIWAVPKLILPFPIYDQQVKLYLRFLKGQVVLPTQDAMVEAMEKDFARRLELGLKARHAHLMQGELQWEYDDEISSLAHIKPLSEAVRNLFRHVHNVRKMDVINYKKKNYTLVDDNSFKEIK